MHKQRVLKTPLVAVLGFLAFLAVPAAAQAHHVNTTAECVVVDNAPTVRLTAYFIGFSSTHSVSGKVKVDNTQRFSGAVPVEWNYQGNANDGRWVFDYSSEPGDHTVQGDFTWSSEGADDDKETLHKVTGCAEPGIEIVKDGPATAYVGSQATFTYQVKNTGTLKLTEPVVTDDKCSPVTKVTNQSSFDPGEVWTYTCTTTITDAMGDELVNVGSVCADWDNPKPDKPNVKVCDTDDHKTKIPKPKVVLEKTGAATAAAGSTFTYSFTAANTGNVALANVQLSDPKCQSTLTRVAGETDTTFDVADQWHYTCTVTAPAGPAQVDNVAEVCGDYDDDTVDKMTVCDEDTHTFTVPPPTTPPTTNPPSSTPNGTPPSGGVLPEEIVSGRAALRGPSGCVRRAFKARVTGRSIASVTFFVDGRRVKRVGRGGAFRLKVNPKRYGLGRHKIVAVVRFTAESGTKSRRLPLTFRRCAQGAVAPRFTG